ncbi:MAG: glycosyl hydrolase family 17 protein [Myxococcaceae bacterium]|jgi:exo-beta-1,3-glucanase (GH17 family)|nr:glycosyl hydrolase family 17 protein [Myxococcaceae bacterium]
MSTPRKNRVMDAPLPPEERLRFTELDTPALVARLSGVLNARVHGLSFSAYRDGQGPDLKTQLASAQIRERLAIVAPYTRWVRTFSCTDGNEHTPALAKAMGLQTVVGAWLGEDAETNAREVDALISLCRAGHVDLAAVGNEVLLRQDLSEAVLVEAMAKVREAVPGIPVGTVDAYYLFCEHPKLVEASDVLFINCYPFWEECSLEHSLAYMKEMVARVRKVAGGKRIVISETGWPSDGTNVGAAIPSERNALLYALNTFEWTASEGLDLFYFSAMDEAWKAGPEGGCGPHWGFWDTEGRPKYGWR